MDAFKLLYTTHTPLIAAFLVYAYTFFPHAHFTAARRSLMLANLLACALSLLWRCAPPRLMPPVTGFVDVLHDHPPTLPNLHLANALLLSTTTLLYAHHTWLRILALLYPAGIALSVIATANNWVLDGASQVLILLLAVYSNRVLLALQPLEGWVFWACRTERPQFHEGKIG
uniref:Inositolphosphotransferase Aur1/Ipt1 domain-containing protein n=1 Tax=Mycena chlorophos TaxID=658473 RepID=A0ABQ0LTK9_MYCCL|nr:predicted protein [Mycena chlorophos]